MNHLDAPSFRELMHYERDQTPVEKILVQAIARLSAAAGYRDLTPEEVYEMLVEQTKSIHNER